MRLVRFLALSVAVVWVSVSARSATLIVTPDKTTYQVGELITLSVLGDAEGAAAADVSGRLLFDSGLANPVDSSQILLESMVGSVTVEWVDQGLFRNAGFADAFSQRTDAFGIARVPINLLEATVVLQATGLGTLNLEWSNDVFTPLRFFGIDDAPGASVMIVPEPMTGIPVGLGLVAISLWRKRSRRRSRLFYGGPGASDNPKKTSANGASVFHA